MITNIDNNIEIHNDVEISIDDKMNECVICLNKINNEPNYFKFNCNHKKYMHNECIADLDKCPLCRQLSNYGYFQNFIELIKNGFCFICKILYLPICFAIIYLILRFITT